jgi:ubiquinone biosynthesis protein
MQQIQQPLPTVSPGPRRSRLGRERHVVTVLTRHGFGLLVQHSRLPIVRRAGLLGRPQSLRDALEELGTTFIKLGQILSTRPDLLPEEYVAALSTLQDSLAPISFDSVRGVIERELGAPPEKLFGTFEAVPLATASIGQVHAATLIDGTSVVVKVQKPGIVAEIELDLQIIHNLSRLAAARIDLPLIWNLEETVEEFSDGLREEVDYLHEARNAERFARVVCEDSSLMVPAVHWDFTTSRVLTLGRIDGVKISDFAGLERLGVDRRRIARAMSGSVLQQVFDYGYFHADPHPGNYLVRGDGVIGIVDFGLMGVLDDASRRDLLLLLASWVREDADGLAEGLLALGVARTGTRTQDLRMDMRRVLGRYHDARLQDINLGKVLSDLFRLARRHRLVLRGDLALMAKTLAMHEGLGSRLDPQFHLVEEARPYVENALRRLYFPKPDVQAAALSLGAMLDLATTFPQRAQRLLGRVERGDIGVAVRPEGMDFLMRDLNHMVNRLSVTILAAAFIVGLALLLQVVENSRGSLFLLFLFAAGLMGASVLGLWILVSMYRAGRAH